MLFLAVGAFNETLRLPKIFDLRTDPSERRQAKMPSNNPTRGSSPAPSHRCPLARPGYVPEERLAQRRSGLPQTCSLQLPAAPPPHCDQSCFLASRTRPRIRQREPSSFAIQFSFARRRVCRVASYVFADCLWRTFNSAAGITHRKPR
jgi:hypothetical protein